jgi:hypothetical protein
MRTLQFTHEEIAILQRSLGIAELKFSDLRKNYIETVANVRGVESTEQARAEANQMLEKELQICNLLADIMSGEKDVK